MPRKKKAPVAIEMVRPWLADQLGRTISDRDVETFRGLVGTLRTSREVLVKVTDGNLLHAAWLWEKQHEARGAILLQLKARLNSKGVRKPALRSVASKPEVPVASPVYAAGELAEAQKALRDLADALPSFVAFGARVSFSFSLGEAITAEERRARRQG